MNDLFLDNSSNLLYSPMIGIYPTKVNIYTDFINKIAKVFFKILDNNNLEYYVFAGSAIGLIRNGKSIPWVDDYDIIVFEKDLDKLKLILKILEHNLFKVKQIDKNTNTICGYCISSPRYKINKTKTSFFQVDIFLSKIENNILKNTNGWGLYDIKNINMSLVKPPRYEKFDNMILPFFNNYENDISIEYGDIINNCVIHVLHGRKKIKINEHWKKVYNDFYNYENIAIENTKILINNYKLKEFDVSQDKYLTDLSISNDNYFELLKHINSNLAKVPEKKIILYNSINTKYIVDIKFFHDIKVEIAISNVNTLNNIRFFLEFIDGIIVANKNHYIECEKFLNNLVIINKPYLIIYPDFNSYLSKTNIIEEENYLINIGEPIIQNNSIKKFTYNIQKINVKNNKFNIAIKH